ncbi:hypothetical protein OE88DRAFT_1659992 [Heliocybe sulcata]|uniref:Uncharacterized protein n=1 Tax=Heliocybe sulcata TaxID=5364 RepID=A0A5C3N079_9AGAM|nr:hypothetical protein OE88DRAFT_1659992 [Heliocybe sulcata]
MPKLVVPRPKPKPSKRKVSKSGRARVMTLGDYILAQKLGEEADTPGGPTLAPSVSAISQTGDTTACASPLSAKVVTACQVTPKAKDADGTERSVRFAQSPVVIQSPQLPETCNMPPSPRSADVLAIVEAPAVDMHITWDAEKDFDAIFRADCQTEYFKSIGLDVSQPTPLTHTEVKLEPGSLCSEPELYETRWTGDPTFNADSVVESTPSLKKAPIPVKKTSRSMPPVPRRSGSGPLGLALSPPVKFKCELPSNDGPLPTRVLQFGVQSPPVKFGFACPSVSSTALQFGVKTEDNLPEAAKTSGSEESTDANGLEDPSQVVDLAAPDLGRLDCGVQCDLADAEVIVYPRSSGVYQEPLVPSRPQASRKLRAALALRVLSPVTGTAASSPPAGICLSYDSGDDAQSATDSPVLEVECERAATHDESVPLDSSVAAVHEADAVGSATSSSSTLAELSPVLDSSQLDMGRTEPEELVNVSDLSTPSDESLVETMLLVSETSRVECTGPEAAPSLYSIVLSRTPISRERSPIPTLSPIIEVQEMESPEMKAPESPVSLASTPTDEVPTLSKDLVSQTQIPEAVETKNVSTTPPGSSKSVNPVSPASTDRCPSFVPSRLYVGKTLRDALGRKAESKEEKAPRCSACPSPAQPRVPSQIKEAKSTGAKTRTPSPSQAPVAPMASLVTPAQRMNPAEAPARASFGYISVPQPFVAQEKTQVTPPTTATLSIALTPPTSQKEVYSAGAVPSSSSGAGAFSASSSGRTYTEPAVVLPSATNDHQHDETVVHSAAPVRQREATETMIPRRRRARGMTVTSGVVHSEAAVQDTEGDRSREDPPHVDVRKLAADGS